MFIFFLVGRNTVQDDKDINDNEDNFHDRDADNEDGEACKINSLRTRSGKWCTWHSYVVSSDDSGDKL